VQVETKRTWVSEQAWSLALALALALAFALALALATRLRSNAYRRSPSEDVAVGCSLVGWPLAFCSP